MMGLISLYILLEQFSSHTKHTSSVLSTINIPQYISYTFPVFRKMRKKQCGLTDCIFEKLVDIFRHLTISKRHYKILKELKRQ